MKIAFRVDTSAVIGTGHFMRCFALARYLKSKGETIIFLSRFLDPKFRTLLQSNEMELYELTKGHSVSTDDYESWLGVSWQDDIKEVGKNLEKESIDWLIVDHYAIDQKWEKEARRYTRKIFVIDDLSNRPHDCDLLLDQNLCEEPLKRIRYEPWVPPSCHCLIGPTYALLRPEFREEKRDGKRGGDPPIQRLFISFGGADVLNQTEKVLRALETTDFKIDVVIGTLNPHRTQLEKFCSQKRNIKCHIGVDQMAELMDQADLAIGSAGTTVWEQCALGLPSLIIPVAKNQLRNAELLEKNGASIHLGWHEEVTPEKIYKEVFRLSREPQRLSEMSKAGRKLVDGRGVFRLSQILTEALRAPQAPEGFRFELINHRHTPSILKWRNDVSLRQNFLDQRTLTGEEQRFFLDDYFLKERLDFVLIDERRNFPVGVFNLKNIQTEPEIGQLIGESSYRGRGLGKEATRLVVQFALKTLGLKSVCARVKEKNLTNIELLKKLNFEIAKQETLQYENYLLFEKRGRE